MEPTRDCYQPPPSNLPTSTSTGLLDRIREGDGQAWRDLVDLYAPLVYYWCRRYVLPPEDATDVMQEVFLAVHKGVGGFRHGPGVGRFRGWLWTITRNRIMDLFRCRKRLPKGRGEVGSLAEIPDRLADPPGDECDINQLGSLFHRAIQLARAEFGDRTWEAFWRATVANEPTRQVAAELGISSNGVRQARSRVLRRIRLLLGGINE